MLAVFLHLTIYFKAFSRKKLEKNCRISTEKMHVEEVPFSALKVYGRISFAVKTNSHLTIVKF